MENWPFLLAKGTCRENILIFNSKKKNWKCFSLFFSFSKSDWDTSSDIAFALGKYEHNTYPAESSRMLKIIMYFAHA